MSRASARRSGTNCGRSRRCSLASASCSAASADEHVAGELQLLAREQQHLLDLGQRPFVARRRELAIQRLERGLLGLRFGEPVFEQRDLGLRFAQALLRFLQRGARRSARRPRSRASAWRPRGAARVLRMRASSQTAPTAMASTTSDDQRRRAPARPRFGRDAARVAAGGGGPATSSTGSDMERISQVETGREIVAGSDARRAGRVIAHSTRIHACEQAPVRGCRFDPVAPSSAIASVLILLLVIALAAAAAAGFVLGRRAPRAMRRRRSSRAAVHDAPVTHARSGRARRSRTCADDQRRGDGSHPRAHRRREGAHHPQPRRRGRDRCASAPSATRARRLVDTRRGRCPPRARRRARREPRAIGSS